MGWTTYTDAERQQYEQILGNMFNCKNSKKFEKLCKTAVNMIHRHKTLEYIRVSIGDYQSEYYEWMNIFSIVLLKNKELIQLLKKNDIVYHPTRNYPPPVFKPLLDRDTDRVDFLVRNGVEIVGPQRRVYYYLDDGGNAVDILDKLITDGNTTAIKYIYKNVPLENIVDDEIRINADLFQYIYDKILPY
jgi:hypothetical protein